MGVFYLYLTFKIRMIMKKKEGMMMVVTTQINFCVIVSGCYPLDLYQDLTSA